MALWDTIDQVDSDDVTLVKCVLGYNILVQGEHVGSIEGFPGRVEYLVVEPPWEGKGIARAALNELIVLSRKKGCSKITTNNDIHPAMKHILETEGFKQQSEGWEKEIC